MMSDIWRILHKSSMNLLMDPPSKVLCRHPLRSENGN